MAIYFLNLKTFGRSSGSSAVNAAAYRAGERIRDERTGRLYDHSNRQDVLHKEIILPDKFAADDMAWAKDRSALWNAAELSETRKNARVARSIWLPCHMNCRRKAASNWRGNSRANWSNGMDLQPMFRSRTQKFSRQRSTQFSCSHSRDHP